MRTLAKDNLDGISELTLEQMQAIYEVTGTVGTEFGDGHCVALVGPTNAVLRDTEDRARFHTKY